MSYEGYHPITDKHETVEPNWLYSYDGGGFPMIIAEIAPVQQDMIGLPAYKAAGAWEYFLKPNNPS